MKICTIMQVGSIATYSPVALVTNALGAMTNPWVLGKLGKLVKALIAAHFLGPGPPDCAEQRVDFTGGQHG